MKLHQKGELQLLKEIKERFNPALKQKGSGVILGIGDDAAVFACPGEKILVTTDMMTEGIHFNLNYTSAFQIGFKLVSVNVSDIYAMGGKPRYIFLNIAMKREASEEFFWDFFNGISTANSIYGVKLLGGDISSAINDMSVSATLIGAAEKIVTRAGAKVGDKIYLTNTTGDSACGLEILRRLLPEGKNMIREYDFGLVNKVIEDKKPLTLNINSKHLNLDFNTASSLIKRHLMPLVKYPREFIDNATAMIDVSDGLFIDLLRICDDSNVGAKVYFNKIPVSYQMKIASSIMGLDSHSLATSGGEDYELLFTAPDVKCLINKGSEHRNSLNNSLNSEPAAITCIGEIIPKERVVIALDGTELPLKAEGYQHFSTQG